MSVLSKKPEIVVFAGPNGSGKSTITELLKPPMDYVNADEIKKSIKCSDLDAAQIAEKQREMHIEQMDEFCFETVLSTERMCSEWYLEDIQMLTAIDQMIKKNLN